MTTHPNRGADRRRSDTPPVRFPRDYVKARTAFMEAAQAAGGGVRSYRNPHRGPKGEDLLTDAALFGPEVAHSAVVLISGTHGVEGFAGSGIQTGLLRGGITSLLPHGVRLVLIHALNPFGMAHLRRFTEENVDLNRNFRDHTQPPPANPGYEALAEAIAPGSMTLWSEICAWVGLLWSGLKAGEPTLRAAIQGGQFSHPTGLFYGGRSDTWSNVTLQSIARDCLSGTDRLVVIDVHTGLGAYGEAEIILNIPPGASEFERAATIWKDERVRSTVSGASRTASVRQSVSVHLDSSVKLAFSSMFPGVEVTAASLEFGTWPPLKVLRALRAENWLHHHGGLKHPRATRIRDRLLRTFHPDDETWEAQVWTVGREVVQKAVAWAGSGHRLDH